MNDDVVKAAKRRADEDIIRRAGPRVSLRSEKNAPVELHTSDVKDSLADWSDKLVDRLARVCEGYPPSAFAPQHGRQRVVVVYFTSKGILRHDIEMKEVNEPPAPDRGKRRDKMDAKTRIIPCSRAEQRKWGYSGNGKDCGWTWLVEISDGVTEHGSPKTKILGYGHAKTRAEAEAAASKVVVS